MSRGSCWSRCLGLEGLGLFSVRVSVRVRVRVRVMVRVMVRVWSGSRGSCRARDWEATGLCRVQGSK